MAALGDAQIRYLLAFEGARMMKANGLEDGIFLAKHSSLWVGAGDRREDCLPIGTSGKGREGSLYLAIASRRLISGAHENSNVLLATL
jgi:hypothetical protein